MPLYQVSISTTERTGSHTSRSGLEMVQVNARNPAEAQRTAELMFKRPTMTKCIAAVIKEIK